MPHQAARRRLRATWTRVSAGWRQAWLPVGPAQRRAGGGQTKAPLARTRAKGAHGQTFAVPPCFAAHLTAAASEDANTPRRYNGRPRRKLLSTWAGCVSPRGSRGSFGSPRRRLAPSAGSLRSRRYLLSSLNASLFTSRFQCTSIQVTRQGERSAQSRIHQCWGLEGAKITSESSPTPRQNCSAPPTLLCTSPDDVPASLADLVARTRDAAAVLVSTATRLDTAYFDACPSVKYVGLCGTSVANIDRDALQTVR